MKTTRRTFLKAGLLSTALLAAAGGWYRVTHPAPPRGFVLDGEARAALGAIVPAMLGGALPVAPADRARAIAATTDRVHQAILGLPLGSQQEVQDLFGLLTLAPARRLLAGVPTGWAEAKEADVAAFLQDWRTHRFALMRTAYAALHDLVLGVWYSDPAHWEAIGYPGPLKELA
jgi:hypothetical protein